MSRDMIAEAMARFAGRPMSDDATEAATDLVDELRLAGWVVEWVARREDGVEEEAAQTVAEGGILSTQAIHHRAPSGHRVMIEHGIDFEDVRAEVLTTVSGAREHVGRLLAVIEEAEEMESRARFLERERAAEAAAGCRCSTVVMPPCSWCEDQTEED